MYWISHQQWLIAISQSILICNCAHETAPSFGTFICRIIARCTSTSSSPHIGEWCLLNTQLIGGNIDKVSFATRCCRWAVSRPYSLSQTSFPPFQVGWVGRRHIRWRESIELMVHISGAKRFRNVDGTILWRTTSVRLSILGAPSTVYPLPSSATTD